MIDIHTLNTDQREIEDRIREVKTALRSTWTRPMSASQYELIDLKARATERYILRAWLRGKFHLADHDRCTEVAEKAKLNYPLAA